MSVPTVEDLLSPVLRELISGPLQSAALASRIVHVLGLQPDVLEPKLRNGQTVFRNRMAWALVWFGKAGLVAQDPDGRYALTSEGAKVAANLKRPLLKADLEVYPGFKNYRKSQPLILPARDGASQVAEATPQEQLEAALAVIEEAQADQLLAEIQGLPALGFERLVKDLLGRILVPGREADAAIHVGKSSDGGVDAVVYEDSLGITRVYAQAKRYKDGNSVGPDTVRSFFGALAAHGAQKGVLATTSTFTAKARSEADKLSLSQRIVLLDGRDLARLMVAHEVGVRVERRIALSQLDLATYKLSN